jgi:hypothetical protein
MVMAAAPKKRRRSRLMCSDILKSHWFEGRPGTGSPIRSAMDAAT